MASLKEYRLKISSVKGTQKITSAMKMVSVARLKKSQVQAVSARPYSFRMEEMVASLALRLKTLKIAGPKLLTGRTNPKVCLFIVIMSDRGLCGGLNVNLARFVKRQVSIYKDKKIKVKFFLIGRKSKSLFQRDYSSDILEHYQDFITQRPGIEHAREISAKLLEMFEGQVIDEASIFFNEFFNAIQQDEVLLPLIPFSKSVRNIPEVMEELATLTDIDKGSEKVNIASGIDGDSQASYEFEPEEEALLATLLPKNIETQIYRALIENHASELAARMTAMDSATRNAGKIIDKLSLEYNRLRQAAITRELIEIVSGAEAL